MNVKKIFDLIFEPVEDEDKEEEVVVDRPLERHNFTDEAPVQKSEEPEVIIKRPETKKKDVLDKTFISADRGTRQHSLDNYNRKPKPVITKYESQPALSPIFGALDSDKTVNQSNYVPTRSYSKKSSLGTVLSPIYGDIGQKEAVEEKEIIEKTNKEAVVFAQSNVKPLENNFNDIKTVEPPSEVKAEMRAREENVVPSISGRTPITAILDNLSEEGLDEEAGDITLFDVLEP